jgi:hypothetical protein
MAGYCEFSDLPTDQCGHCHPPAPVRDTMIIANEGQRGRWIDAKFHGTCSGCGDHITPGEQIRADGEGGWECADCE